MILYMLVVSPHLDDAALSFGASIAELSAKGSNVLVYTVFAGIPNAPFSPAAEIFHAEWALEDDPISRRRTEDRAAIATLGATPIHGDHLDAIYRRIDDGSWLIEGSKIISVQQTDEADLVDSITETICSLIATHAPEILATCSAVGDHVDHQRARDATVRASMRSGVPLQLWEDLPYGIKKTRIPPLPTGATLGAPFVRVGERGSWEAKIKAVSEYTSQLAALEVNATSIQANVDLHGVMRGSEAGLASHGELTWPVIFTAGSGNAQP